MKDKDLAGRLRNLGLPLFEKKECADANLAMADMARSGELRFWEAFPVVLANSAESGLFDYDKAVSHLKKPSERSSLASLAAMSLALYKSLGMRYLLSGELLALAGAGKKEEYESFLAAFKNNDDFDLGGRKMSAERVKKVFNEYLKKEAGGLRDLLTEKEELGLEHALSQVFSSKQRELFLKKLRGEAFTKTEKEYFSRVVKKKVSAFANPELHRLSRKLLEE